VQEIISDATGVVLSTPEYHGSYSSVIKFVVKNLLKKVEVGALCI